MLNTKRRYSSLPRYVACVSVLSCFVLLGLITGCKKQDVRHQTHEQDGTSSNLPTAASARNATPLSDVDKAALQTLLIQHPTVYDADPQVAAAKLLGEHRCVEAVPILIEKIDVIHSTGPANIQNPQASYPAAAALVRIGKPAIPQITAYFEESSNEVDAYLLIETLAKIAGKSWTLNYLNRLQARKTASKVDLARLSQWVSSFPNDISR